MAATYRNTLLYTATYLVVRQESRAALERPVGRIRSGAPERRHGVRHPRRHRRVVTLMKAQPHLFPLRPVIVIVIAILVIGHQPRVHASAAH